MGFCWAVLGNVFFHAGRQVLYFDRSRVRASGSESELGGGEEESRENEGWVMAIVTSDLRVAGMYVSCSISSRLILAPSVHHLDLIPLLVWFPPFALPCFH